VESAQSYPNLCFAESSLRKIYLRKSRTAAGSRTMRTLQTKSEEELWEVFGRLHFYDENPKKLGAEDEAPETLEFG
jgi:hypothetical protein